MGMEQILHMNEGEGGNSYAKNSLQQKEVILKTKPLVEQSLFDLYSNGFHDCIRFADMGCSSGPNSLLPTWEVIESLKRICLRLNSKPPVVHAFLNDLPGSDFNTTFKYLSSFYERLRKEKGSQVGSCYVSAVPGSFYERLFPPNFLHLVYSSYCLHWLSQEPEGLVSGSYRSDADVHNAYLDQFARDFSAFLKSRSEELKPGGRMILSFSFNESHHCTPLEIIKMAIKDMVSEGLIEESKLESFNFPLYSPSIDEVKQIIKREGSFDIHQLETFTVSWLVGLENDDKALDKYEKGKYVTRHIRAVTESVVSNHFGDAFMEEIYHRFSIKATDEVLEKGRGENATLLISLLYPRECV